MKKRMLADVLWEAANNVLSAVSSSGWNGYSCCATAVAARARGAGRDYRLVLKNRAVKFLDSLGCNVTTAYELLGDHNPGEDRQGVRYMWLLLAMHVAEDEGIEA